VEGKKLSTDRIKEMMKGWLNDPSARKRLDHFVDIDRYYLYQNDDRYRALGVPKDSLQEFIDRSVASFGLKPGLTVEEARQKIWDLWCNPKSWQRTEKRRLGEDHPDFIYEMNGSNVRGGFMEDFMGDHDRELCARYAGRSEAEKCIYRLFDSNLFGNSYRLEVVTTPDDSHIIGWVIVEDL
jgi:hypothetical protein